MHYNACIILARTFKSPRGSHLGRASRRLHHTPTCRQRGGLRDVSHGPTGQLTGLWATQAAPMPACELSCMRPRSLPPGCSVPSTWPASGGRMVTISKKVASIQPSSSTGAQLRLLPSSSYNNMRRTAHAHACGCLLVGFKATLHGALPRMRACKQLRDVLECAQKQHCQL